MCSVDECDVRIVNRASRSYHAQALLTHGGREGRHGYDKVFQLQSEAWMHVFCGTRPTAIPVDPKQTRNVISNSHLVFIEHTPWIAPMDVNAGNASDEPGNMATQQDNLMPTAPDTARGVGSTNCSIHFAGT
jgi:hypothetical protein